MVRDETLTLPRLVASLNGRIAAWTVLDTGSADNTPQLAHQLLGHLPGAVHHTAWVDFSTNRNQLLDLAREQTTDFLLLADADHTFTFTTPTPWEDLADPAYLLNVTEPAVTYAMPYLIARTNPARYRGRTHETLQLNRPATIWPHVTITHHGDGGHKRDKPTRDLELLTQDLAEDPTNTRAAFYLARTLHQLGEPTAQRAYRARAAMTGGFDQETWLAGLYAADLEVSDSAADRSWREVLGRRPHRPEPYLRLAVSALGRHDTATALAFTRAGQHLPPTTDVLFVETWIARWGFDAAEWAALTQLEQDTSGLWSRLPTQAQPYAKHWAHPTANAPRPSPRSPHG